jgi:hypothetical protein
MEMAWNRCGSGSPNAKRAKFPQVFPVNSATVASQEDRSWENKIHMREHVEVKVNAGANGFAEDKDSARELRKEVILPSLLANKTVILNFCGVTSSTQSFVHALIAEPLQKMGESVLRRLEFRSCAPQVKNLVELVVDYSLGGFSTSSSMQVGTVPKKRSERPVVVRKERKRK